MKQRDFKACVLCGKGVMHAGAVSFFRLRIERMVIDVGAVRRQHGLEMMMGAAAPLAAVMGPDQDLARPIEPAQDVLLCESCAIDPEAGPFFLLYEAAGKIPEAAR